MTYAKRELILIPRNAGQRSRWYQHTVSVVNTETDKLKEAKLQPLFSLNTFRQCDTLKVQPTEKDRNKSPSGIFSVQLTGARRASCLPLCGLNNKHQSIDKVSENSRRINHVRAWQVRAKLFLCDKMKLIMNILTIM